MAQRSRPTVIKRQREQARIAKRKDKDARRAERSRQSRAASPAQTDIDPDIAGIQPGPQPPAWWQIDEEEQQDDSKPE